MSKFLTEAKLLKFLKKPRFLIVFLMGFSSGLPFLLVGGTLKAWLTESGIDLAVVGFFSAVTLPYTWKFIWSPIMDRFVPPLGRRRGWLAISQVGLVLGLVGLASFDPAQDLYYTALFAVVVAFFSASQDIVIDAYRREILPTEELGSGSSLNVLGYRLAMLTANAGALLLADVIPWPMVYLFMASLMSVGLLTTLFSPEPKIESALPKTLRESVYGPLQDFFSRSGAWSILLFVLLYKIGDSMASDMLNPFYLKMGFSKSEISTVAKLFGFWFTIIGSLIGGVVVLKFKLYKSLWWFGILQALSTFCFVFLAMAGHDRVVLATVVAVENLTMGMGTSAFVAFMAAQTNRRFTATQYALLSSLMGVPRSLFGSTTGVLANHLGWVGFFTLCTVIAIPGLLMLLFLKDVIKQSERDIVEHN